MKNIKLIILSFLFIAFASCEEDERGTGFLDNAEAPSEVVLQFRATQDNSGLVTITPTAVGATNFEVRFGDGADNSVSLDPGQSADNVYAEGTYTVAVTATSLNGLTTEAEQQLVVSFEAPQNLMVTIENDAVLSKQVNVTATADFAMSYDVYFGEPGNDAPLTSNIGEAVSYTYQDAGAYTITIVAMGAAIETTTYVEENFVVTEILAPIVSAETPPLRADEDVISIFSDAYTDVTLDELPTDWSSADFEASTIDTDNVWKLTNLDFIGIVTNYANGIDVSSMEKLHIDYWVPSGTTNELLVKIVNTVDGGEDIESLGTTVEGSWQSIDIDMTGFDGGNLANKNKITQIIIDSDGVAGIVYVDNFYFWKAPTTFPNVSDDFEGNGTITSWFGDACGMDNMFANPYINSDNSSATVLEYDDTGGQYANVRFDVSPNFNFAEKKSFSLKIYVASGDVTGSQTNQISLKLQDGSVGEPWAQQTEIVKPIVLDAWQTVIFDFENDVTGGAPNPLDRTDFNRIVLQVNGENNNDNVKAYIDDFQWGNDLFVGPIPNDDFEGSGNITTWFGDACGANTGFANPYSDSDNASATVLEYDDTGGQYANVRFDTADNFNMEKHTFSLKIYVASTDVTGTQTNQISLKLQDGTVGEPWAQQTEIVKTIVLDTWQTLVFNFETDTTAGAANPLDRTDFNRVVLQVNGENNTDNVKAYIDDIIYY